VVCVPVSASELVTAPNLHRMTSGLSHFSAFGLVAQCNFVHRRDTERALSGLTREDFAQWPAWAFAIRRSGAAGHLTDAQSIHSHKNRA
jgi:hypothetical protein